MTGRHYTDCCPACGSSDIIPYAVLVGGSEEYGYQCAACQVMWPVLTYSPISIGGAERQDSPTA
jgi:transposase-like protein